jgi:hypothetical protein
MNVTWQLCNRCIPSRLCPSHTIFTVIDKQPGNMFALGFYMFCFVVMVQLCYWSRKRNESWLTAQPVDTYPFFPRKKKKMWSDSSWRTFHSKYRSLIFRFDFQYIENLLILVFVFNWTTTIGFYILTTLYTPWKMVKPNCSRNDQTHLAVGPSP